MVGALILLVGGQPSWFFAASTVVVLVARDLRARRRSPCSSDRSFFGVSEVLRDDGITILMHGTTPHGAEWKTPPASMSRATTTPAGPVGDLFASSPTPTADADIRVAGLGAGSLALYARPGDDLAFYEIDPLVARIAEDPALFTYLSDAGDTSPCGSATGGCCSGEDPSSVDIVVLDAFTSDACPCT